MKGHASALCNASPKIHAALDSDLPLFPAAMSVLLIHELRWQLTSHDEVQSSAPLFVTTGGAVPIPETRPNPMWKFPLFV
jgi:hypothetical protein